MHGFSTSSHARARCQSKRQRRFRTTQERSNLGGARWSSLDDLTAMATEVTCNQNQTIYFEGDLTEHCYRVANGIVRICKETEDGRRQIAAFLSTGDLFGWSGTRHHTCSAEAATDVMLLRWPRQVIETTIINNTKTGYKLLMILFEQLVESQNHLLLLGRMPASARIASFLLGRAEHYERNRMHSTRFPFRISRRDLSDHLGLTVETVSRTMHAFKRQGLIDFVLSEQVEIRDRLRLQLIADGITE